MAVWRRLSDGDDVWFTSDDGSVEWDVPGGVTQVLWDDDTWTRQADGHWCCERSGETVASLSGSASAASVAVWVRHSDDQDVWFVNEASGDVVWEPPSSDDVKIDVDGERWTRAADDEDVWWVKDADGTVVWSLDEVAGGGGAGSTAPATAAEWNQLSDDTDKWYARVSDGEVVWQLPADAMTVAVGDVVWTRHRDDDDGDEFWVSSTGATEWSLPDTTNPSPPSPTPSVTPTDDDAAPNPTKNLVPHPPTASTTPTSSSSSPVRTTSPPSSALHPPARVSLSTVDSDGVCPSSPTASSITADRSPAAQQRQLDPPSPTSKCRSTPSRSISSIRHRTRDTRRQFARSSSAHVPTVGIEPPPAPPRRLSPDKLDLIRLSVPCSIADNEDVADSPRSTRSMTASPARLPTLPEPAFSSLLSSGSLPAVPPARSQSVAAKPSLAPARIRSLSSIVRSKKWRTMLVATPPAVPSSPSVKPQAAAAIRAAATSSTPTPAPAREPSASMPQLTSRGGDTVV